MGKYKSLLFFGFFMLAIYFCIPSSNYNDCKWSADFSELKFEGVVQKKYLDKSDHSTPKVEMKSFHNGTDILDLFGEGSGIYETVHAGDTIKKLAGTMQVLKIENKEYVPFKTANFGCDSAELQKEKYLFKLYSLLGLD